MIDAGISLLFDGLNSAIPENWVRASIADVYPMSTNDVELVGDAGGSLTHSHAILHTHTLASHSHTGRTQTAYKAPDCATYENQGGALKEDHYHTYDIAGVSGGTSGNPAATLATASNHVANYRFIPITCFKKANVPAGACVMTADQLNLSKYNTYAFHSASANRYVCFAAEGDDAGEGESGDHYHDAGHTHSVTGHTHSGSTNYPNTSSAGLNSGGSDSVNYWHAHTQTLASGTQNMNAYSGNSETVTNDVTRTQLNIYKAVSASKPFKGLIGMLLDDRAIPANWFACDGQDERPLIADTFVKNNSSPSTFVSSVGSNSHVHADIAHTHTGNGTHTHTDGGTSAHSGNCQMIGNGANILRSNLTHSNGGFTCSSVTADYASSTMSFASVDAVPPYIKVRFIWASSKVAGGASPFLMMLPR